MQNGYKVRKFSVKDIILKACNDEWDQMIIDRIVHVSYLVAVDAKYHNACMKNLYYVPSPGLKRGQ